MGVIELSCYKVKFELNLIEKLKLEHHSNLIELFLSNIRNSTKKIVELLELDLINL